MNKQNPDQVLSLEEEIFQSYSADSLQDIFYLYLKDFLQSNPRLPKDWNLDTRQYEGLSIRKREIVRLFAIICSDKELFLSWSGQLPYIVFKVLETLVWEGKTTIVDLNRRSRQKIFPVQTDNRFDRHLIRQEYCLFLVLQTPIKFPEREAIVYFDIPSSLRKKLRQYLAHPKGYHLKSLKQPEQTSYLFSDQGGILEALPIAIEFIKQDKLQCNKNGIPHRRSLARLNKVTNLVEFYPDQTDSGLKILRTRFIAELLLLGNKPETVSPPVERIKCLLQQYLQADGAFCFRFMEQIRGWYHAAQSVRNDFHLGFYRLLQEMPEEKWLSVQQLSRFARVRELDLCPVSDEAYQYLFLTGEWKGWGNTREYILPDRFEPVITRPLLKSALFLFASIGLLDLMYESPNDLKAVENGKPVYSDFCGLRYVRLTCLGAFVIGKNSEYPDFNGDTQPTHIDLDENRLFLTLDKNDPGKEMNLEQIGERIGKYRYKLSFQSFLADCYHSDDVDIKIRLFYETVGALLPPLWQDFLDGIQQRKRAFQKTDHFKIFKINKNNRELIKLIENDPEIRDLILLMEDYHIAIPDQNILRLKQKLIKFGYFFH